MFVHCCVILAPDTHPPSSLQLVPVTRIDENFDKVTKGDSLDTQETVISKTLADDSEVIFGQQEEIAGAIEMEGSSTEPAG